ncbi:MAG: CARDB domain-containing protein [Chloroflexota bacterium]
MLYSFTLTLLLIMVLAGCTPQTVNVTVVSGTPVQPIPTGSLATPIVLHPAGYSSETPLPTLDVNIVPTLVQLSIPVETAAPLMTSVAPNISTLLPDLVALYSYLEIEGRTENCIYGFGGYEVRVVVKNIGATAANGFFVELNGVRQFHEGQLLPDQSAVIHFSGAPSNGSGQIHVDSTDLVQELNEDNNVGQYIAITPTLPMLCTPTPSPVP